MPALRFLALATLVFVLPAGAFLWYQQIARLEREAVRVLRGPALALAPGARVTWRVDLAASAEDQAWMHAQRQPRLSVSLPVTPSGSERPRLRARACYLAAGALPEAPAFIGNSTAPNSASQASARDDSVREAEPGPDGTVQLGPLWLSYLQPLEVELEVVAWPTSPDLAGFAPVAPVLSGEVSADYAFARQLDRSIFVVFSCLGVLGVVLFVLAERRRGYIDPGSFDQGVGDRGAATRVRGGPAPERASP